LSPIGSKRQIDPFFSDQLHVAKQAGVTGDINFYSPLGLVSKKPGRIAAVAAVGQARAVNGKVQFEITEG
jgi:hypothetical protein